MKNDPSSSHDSGAGYHVVSENESDSNYEYSGPPAASTSSPASGSSDESLAEEMRSTPLNKRKRGIQEDQRIRTKQLREHYSDDYRRFFNRVVQEILEPGASLENDILLPGQIGMTLWSSEEKKDLFRALARRGRHSIRRIAAEIDTKTDFEVSDYLQLLHQGYAEQLSYESEQQPLFQEKMPAAHEISDEYNLILDQLAEALGFIQQDAEATIERHKYSAIWKSRQSLRQSNSHFVRWLEERLENGDKGLAEIRNLLPAAELLNLKHFLRLSEVVFMNSNVPDYNWRNHTERGEGPSIMYTAFADFQTLAVCLTRKLVQSSIFFALSRMKAADSFRYSPIRKIRRLDVMAAINAQGIKASAKQMWSRVAERNHLDIYLANKRGSIVGDELSYESVKRRLDKNLTTQVRSDEDSSTNSMDSEDHMTEAAPLSSPDESENSVSRYSSQASLGSAGLSTDTSNSPLEGRRTPRQRQKQSELERQEDEYLDSLDSKASMEEERQIRSVLGS